MINLKTKESFNLKSKIINNCYLYMFIIPTSSLFFLFNFLSIWLDFSKFLNVFNIVLISCLIVSFVIIKLINLRLNIYYLELLTIELKNIIKEVKLPKILPKVVYVYSAYNDFQQIKMLQNMKQTYKNIEYWISDSLSDKKKSKEIKEFCKKYNVNYYSTNRANINKTNNLNYFLNESKIKFDYLLVSDNDVIIDKNFVLNSLKFFYSEHTLNLGYVSSMTINNPGNNIFSNSLLSIENQKLLFDSFKMLKNNCKLSMYSSCCLISHKMLEDLYATTKYDIENWSLENKSFKNMWNGIILPNTIALQSFDKNVYQYINRQNKTWETKLKWIKKENFLNFNFHQKRDLNATYCNMFIGLWIILGFLMLSVFIWQLFIHGSANLYFPIIVLTVILINIIFYIIGIFFMLKKLWYKPNIIVFLLTKLLYYPLLLVNILKIWFKVLISSKFLHFNKSKLINSEKWMLLINCVILILFTVILIMMNLLFFLWTNVYNINDGWKYLVIFINLIIISFIYYSFSFVILYAIGNIKSQNIYWDNTYIYCENKFINNLQQKNRGNRNV